MSVQSIPGFDLQPSSERVALPSNYITNFNFLNQYLPDTYEKEFERYGNRTIASFLRMVGAEMPTNSDMIKWAEQGRLHTKYVDVTLAATGATTGVLTVADVLNPAGSNIAVRVGQTLFISDNTPGSVLSNKAVVTAVTATTIDVAFYEALSVVPATPSKLTVMIYGSEFAKGTSGMVDSLEANDVFFDNKPIIIKDTYEVSGSDMAQIGWVEIQTENGGSGYLWYMKSEHETRLRFEDYLETAMIEAVPAAPNSGAEAALSTSAGAVGTINAGSEGVFHVVNTRGNVWGGGNPTTLAGFDTVIQRLDKQGAIEENVIFVDRQFSFDIDDMLAQQNSYGAGGTSYGLFDNDEDMALNLGFTGFRRGYDFYKSDWKLKIDVTKLGLLVLLVVQEHLMLMQCK